MAQKEDRRTPLNSREAIRERLGEARCNLSTGLAEMRESANVPRRLEGSIRRHTGRWVLGALAGGFVLTKLVFRRRSGRDPDVQTRRARLPVWFLGPVAKAGIDLLKPMLACSIEERLRNLDAGPPPEPLDSSRDGGLS